MNAQEDTQRAAASRDMLVVDDDPRNRKLLEEYLTAAGYTVRMAENGRTALDAAAARPPDIVFLDVMMPDISGLDVCYALKSSPETRLAQVVLVTALDGSPARVEGLDRGADDFISKPVRREEFLAKVRSLLRARDLMAELERARADLAERNARLLDFEALKETLSQTLVHDLKNPLTAILANLDLLERKVPPECARLVERCRTSSRRMHRMILDLLDIGGLEEGKLHLQFESADARDIVRRAVDEAEGSARQREVILAFDESDAPCPVRADTSILTRVVDNLLTNGIEHTARGGTVRARIAPCDEGILLEILDQGPGIPAEHRERIFEKYARLELKSAGIGANRGLGLTLARLAVEAHGGTIWVDDAPGGGAVFRAIFPACERGAAARAAEATNA